MEIPDAEVYKTLQKVAAMEPSVERVVKFIDNGELNRRIEKSVKAGVESCPFYIEEKLRKRIRIVGRWIVTVGVPALVTLITLIVSGVFKRP